MVDAEKHNEASTNQKEVYHEFLGIGQSYEQ